MPNHPTPAKPGAAGALHFDSRLATWTIGLTFLVLAANWIAAVGLFQVNVLFWDQWSFFTPIMQGRSWWGIFDWQHGPHRQGIAYLLTTWIMGACGWDERVDSAWICCILFVAAGLGLLLQRRLAGPLRAGDAWVVLAVLALGQCDSVITTPNASHSVFPLMLMLALALLLLPENPVPRYLLSAACAVLLEFTGFGLFAAAAYTLMMAVAAAAEFRAGRPRTALFASGALALALAGWALFLHGYVFDPASPGFRFPWTPLYEYGQFLLLMLTAPAGWEGASALHYAAGLVCAGAVLALLFHGVRRFLRNPVMGSPESIILFLTLTSALYAADTAVGRVQLGVAEGLTSRYITLLIPAYLALHLWASRGPSPWRLPTLVVLWALVAYPYLPLAGRPLSRWMGSMGLTDSRLAWVQSVADQKLSFVMLYEREGDPRRVARSAHALVFPETEMDYLDARLAYLRLHRLSFFAHPGVPFGYAPWLVRDPFFWLSAFPSEGRGRWIGESAELEVGAPAGAYLNFRILERLPALPPGAALAVRVGEKRADVDLAVGSQGVSLPLEPGAHLIRFESTEGALTPGNGDTRRLSFLISEPTVAQEPSFRPWVWETAQGAYAPAWDLKVLSGFHGWENSGAFGWTSERLELSASARAPAYLNVAIAERLRSLADGPVVVSCGSFRREFPLPREGLSFSLELSQRQEPYVISILNSTGAAEPRQSGASSDGRSLALRLTRLSVDPAPAYQVLPMAR